MTPEVWHQVNELFHAALERPVEERISFLDELRQSDPFVFSEVKSLIDAHEMPNLIDQPVFALVEDILDDEPESLIGRSLAHYEIVSDLGKGGMGEVYLARDSKLDRKVALKLLPARFTTSRERLTRFVQEAKLASALSHPNIITVHEIGREGDTHYIATEFVEGSTLRDRLRQGALSVDETLTIGIQIGRALSAAHRAGVIHRDVKPENVMVRPDGYVKVLDFGLATLSEGAREPSDSTAARTEWVHSEPGVLMGTVRYMSPEQAAAQPIDLRTDIFSLGLVMYEMLAGRHPFEGMTGSETLTAIMTQEPDPIGKHEPSIPAALARVVLKAIEKDPALRYQSMDELIAEIERLKADSEFNARLIARGTPISTPAARLAVAAIIVAISGLAAWLALKGSDLDNDRPPSFRFVPIADWKVAADDDTVAARFSPDGTKIAFSSNKSGRTKTWIKELSARDAVQLTTGDSLDRTPIWSPDGGRVAFASNREGFVGVWVVPVHDGRSPVLLKALQAGRLPLPDLKRWSNDGSKIYYELNRNLFALDIASETVQQLTDFVATKRLAPDFSVSPDEERIAFVDDTDGKSDVWVMSFGSAPVRVTNDAAEDFEPVWRPDGQSVIYTSLRDGTRQVCVAHMTGRGPRQITFGKDQLTVSDVSPDGTGLLCSISIEESDIWLVETESRKESEVTSEIGAEFWPEVSPDGRMLVFQATTEPGGGSGIYSCSIMALSIANRDQRVELSTNGFAPRWSPHGSTVAFLRNARDGLSIWSVTAAGADEKRLTQSGVVFNGFSRLPYSRLEPSDFSWSPDAKQIAYCATKQGISNVHRTASDGSGITNVSANEDRGLRFHSPIWASDGKRIAYASTLHRPDEPDRVMIWIHDGERATPILDSGGVLHLLGWSHSGDSVYVAKREGSIYQQNTVRNVTLLRVSSDGYSTQVASLEQARDVHLAPSADAAGFVSRRNGSDDVWVVPTNGGRPRKVTSNSDPGLYISSLAWSADGRIVYYGKQWKKSQVAILENFN
jgi:serine/threonine protein kinase/tricorn protease-like protein